MSPILSRHMIEKVPPDLSEVSDLPDARAC